MLVLGGASLALYLPFLGNPLVFDDLPFFKLGEFQDVFIAGFSLERRWLPHFLTAWVELLFDKNSLPVQRLINLGLHLASSLTLYSLVKRISGHVVPHVNNERAALAAALLFLLHPLAVYAVAYLIERTILMATLFGLLSLSAYFDGLLTRKKTYFVLSALFYFLSAHSKEHAVLIPAVALSMSALVGRFDRKMVVRLAFPLALFLPVFVLIVFKSTGVVGKAYEPESANFLSTHVGAADVHNVWLLSIATQASLYFKYLLLTFFPLPAWMSIDMRVPFDDRLTNPKYLLGVGAYLVYGITAAVLIAKGGRKALAGFALISPWLTFGVEFSAVRIQEPFVLYRAYLWIPLLFLLVPALTNKLSGRVFWVAILGVSIAFSAASWDRLESFSSGFALWNDAVRKLPDRAGVPGVERAYFNRANEYFAVRNVPAAIADYTRAIEINPSLSALYLNRAYAYWQSHDLLRAEKDVEASIRLDSTSAQAYYLSGLINRKNGINGKAVRDFEKACKLGLLWACKGV
ncbi:MAG TPA: tetratricopeptide repeat protein [Thiobacillus sp.]